ncbi:MAG: hypothetical protein H0T73_09690, partial [Ardenticatenales bacterium]|nr:hypothetical protein [Ardenticatenales bacterium]
MLVYDAFGNAITLTEEMTRGQEATLYRVRGRAEQVAKLYLTYRPEYEEKLRWMISHPPVLPGQTPFVGVAWPQSLLYNVQARFVGFLMPRIHPAYPVAALWEEAAHTGKARHRAAYTLAQSVGIIHAQGYVLGTLNLREVLALRSGGVVLVDADSYQVQVPQLVGSRLYPASVAEPEYTPPERQFR